VSLKRAKLRPWTVFLSLVCENMFAVDPSIRKEKKIVGLCSVPSLFTARGFVCSF
jgi:hypothetical protein